MTEDSEVWNDHGLFSPAMTRCPGMQLRDKRSCWSFERPSFCWRSCRLALWNRASLYPRTPRGSCTQIWFAVLEVNGLRALDSSCDIDDSVVWKSIFRLERTLPCWGSLEVCQWPGELEMQRNELHTLRFWLFVRILPDDFSLGRFLAGTFLSFQAGRSSTTLSSTSDLTVNLIWRRPLLIALMIIKHFCFLGPKSTAQM